MTVYLHTASGSLGSSETFAHTMHSGRVPGDIDTAHGDFTTGFGVYTSATGVLADYSAAVRWTRLVTTELDAAGNPVDMRESATSLQGSSGFGSLPYEVSMCISERTAQAGRSGRGRFYLPPMDTTVMDGTTGLFQAAERVRHVNAVAAWYTSMLTAGSVPVVWSRTLLQDFPVTTVAAGLVPDAQTRRRRSQEESYISAVV